ncbi:hypothetical protein ACJIZ3_008412 [Penstemon smallii]|uniref:F-box domain-containing protein n=1 Tax=Penstemon smallii TaxID=265156 RepID=A0ABD3T9N2_9LAMI
MDSIAAEKVEVNDDVLTSILVRLPPKSVFRFRCVSYKWYNMIADPYFLKSYSAITTKHPLSGERLLPFAQLTNMHLVDLKGFINSSNGLILLGRSFLSTTYYQVLNPLTQKCVSLPPRKKFTNQKYRYRETSIGLVTGTWAISTLVSTAISLVSFDLPPLVFHGVVHWCKNNLRLIMLPSCAGYSNSSFTRSESDDFLWYVTTDTHLAIGFWMLPKNKEESYRGSNIIPANEWSLMHTIRPSSLQKEPIISLLQNINRSKLVWLEALISCNNRIVAVLMVGDILFLYNLESKSIESVLYSGGRPINWWYDYMETRYLSSYAL